MSNSATLIDQIGNYSNDSSSREKQQEQDSLFTQERLEGEGITALYRGISTYRSGYESLIRRNYPNASIDSSQLNNRRFFREKFASFMAKKNDSPDGKYNGDPALRANHPEKATIAMNDFLGEQGAKLYQLALEEEMNSEEYMNAVFRASTTHFDGEKWAERPVVIVAGPSGCGKSHAAKAALEKANEFLAKQDNNLSGNDVVAVDGGIVREVSQMRKLAIQVANNKGYTGISDLHSQSKVLEGVKDRIQEAVLDPTTKVGVVIPETFSDFANPLNKKKLLLKSINNLPNAKPIFCRVDGENPSIFQRIVAFMGSRRAWKTSGFEEEMPLNLNNTKITESKSYKAGGFRFGQLGSFLAELWFKKNAKIDLSMKIINDLVLVKPAPPDSQNWVNARQGEPGAQMISKRVLEQWENYLALLPEEKRGNPPLTLDKFAENNTPSTIIQTSGEMDLAIAKESLRKRIIVLKNDIANAYKQDPHNPNIRMLVGKLDKLEVISGNLNLVDDKTKKGIIGLKDQLRRNINEMDTNGDFGFFSRTEKALNHALNALDKIVKEMSQEESANETNIKSYKEYKMKYLSELDRAPLPDEGIPSPSPSF